MRRLDQETGVLRVMLVNRSPDAAIDVGLDVAGFTADGDVARYVYSPADLDGIVADTTSVASPVTLPASSITVLALA